MPICLHHVVAHKPGYASLVWGRGRGVLSPWCLGDRPRGPAVCLQVLPHVTAGELRLRCRLVSLMSGKLRYTRSMQASCLGSPWQSLRSTDFPDCWKRWPAGIAKFWHPCTLMPRSLTSALPRAPGNGRWTNYAWWSDPHLRKTKRRPCRALALLWDLPMTRVASIRQVMFVFGPAPDSMAKFVISCHSTSSRPLYSRHSFQTLWTCKLLGARYFWVSREWRSHGHQGTQLELSMVLCVLIERPDLFRHRHGLWFLDNVAAVMTLVRGRSSNSGLAKLGHLIHLALFALRAQHLRVPHTCHEYGLTF